MARPVGDGGFELLASPPSGWAALLEQDPNATPAHRPELWAALADTYGMSARFVAVPAESGLVGGAALLVERRAGFHWIRALPHLLGAAPLARAGRHDEVDLAVARGVDALAERLHAVGGEWALYRPQGPEPSAATLERVGGETRRTETTVADLDEGIDAVFRRLPASRRSFLRSRMPRYAFAEEPEAFAEAYALHARQAHGWDGYRPLPLELGRRLLAARGAHGPLARLFTLRGRGRLLSAGFFLDHPRELFVWWTGTHPLGREQHVYELLLWGALEWAARAGRARFNLGGSAGSDSLAAFKRSLGGRAVAYPVRWLDARHASWGGRLVHAAQARVRRGRFRGAPA